MQIPFFAFADSSARSVGRSESAWPLRKTQQFPGVFYHHRAQLGIAQAQLTQLKSSLRDQIVGKRPIGLAAIAAQDHMRRSDLADRVMVLLDGEAGARAAQETGHKFDIRAERSGFLHLCHAHVDRIADRVRRDDPIDALAPGFAYDEQRFVRLTHGRWRVRVWRCCHE